ncbi:hypothetical protein CRYUN_Cryun30bG0021800 [Craigia yunnanensis]
MAKIALILVFSLALVLSIQSVIGDDVLSPEQINEAASEFKEAAQSLSSSTGNAAESVKESASSWTDWAKDKLRGYGLLSPKESRLSASAPENRPAPAYARSFGRGPAAAPMY